MSPIYWPCNGLRKPLKLMVRWNRILIEEPAMALLEIYAIDQQ